MALKNLKDTRSDLQRCNEREADLKDRLFICKNQVEDINEKLAVKLDEIVTLTKNIQKLEKANREAQRDYEKCLENLKVSQDEVKDLRLENEIQKNELRENDLRFIKMKNQMDKLIRERDLGKWKINQRI